MLRRFLLKSLITLAVIVAVFVAGFALIVKPLVDTANNTIDKAFTGGDEIVAQLRGALDDAGIDDLNIDLGSKEQGKKLLRCVRRAGQDETKVRRCKNRLG